MIDRPLVVGSRSCCETAKAALANRRPSPGHQEGARTAERDWQRPSADAVRTQITWRCVMQTLPQQHCRLKDHSLTNWKPMKCREDRRGHDDERWRSGELLHFVTTAGDRDGRRQRRQKVSCNSPAGNSQIPGPEQCRFRRQRTKVI